MFPGLPEEGKVGTLSFFACIVKLLLRITNWILGLWIILAAGWAAIWKLAGDRNGKLCLVNTFAFWILGTAWLASWFRTLLGGHWWSLLIGEGLGVLFLRHFAWIVSRREQVQKKSDLHTSNLKLVTANLLKKSVDLTSTAEAFQNHQVDVALLQEVTPGAFSSLKGPLCDSHPWSYWVSNPMSRLGLGVVSSLPVVVEKQWSVGITGPYCLRMRFLAAGASFLIYNLHLVSPLYNHPEMTPDRSLAIRTFQLETILEDAKAQDGPVLLMGDWNATEGSDIYRKACISFVDVWAEYGHGPGWTWPHNLEPHMNWPFKPCLRLDHVFCSKDLAMGRPQVLDITSESDHSPVLVSFRWPSEEDSNKTFKPVF